MPLTLLLTLVVVGIGGIALALHLLGLTARQTLTDKAEARTAWLRESPEDTPTHIVMAADNRAALIIHENGRGVVWRIGDDTVARPLEGATITRRADTLLIDFPDFGSARLRVLLAPQDITDWIPNEATA